MVPNPNDPITKFFELSCALFILLDLIGMVRSVQLYDEFFLFTNKVGDKFSDDNLTTELIPAKPFSLNFIPEFFL